jgi:phosphoribosylpyrophosphate synthetase
VTVYFNTLRPGQGQYGGADIGYDCAELFTYPAGELHLMNVTPQRGSDTVFIADVRGCDVQELVYASMFADVAHQRGCPFVLLLPYLPAARSDRGEPTGAAVYARLINSMHAEQVIGVDAHSKVIARLIDNLTVLHPDPLVEVVLREAGVRYDGVIAPDTGAVKRARSVAATLQVPCYHAHKDRDFDTGEIRSITMSEQLDGDHTYLVVDDICDGGGTFVGLAKATGLPRTQLGLWCSHYTGNPRAVQLRECYDRFYTTDSHPGHNTLADGVAVADVRIPLKSSMWNAIKDFT